MTSSRVRRALVFLCATAALVAPPRAAERPVPDTLIDVDSLRVTNARFSPNDDGARDEVSFTLWFTAASSIHVHISPAGLPDTVAVIVNTVPDPRVALNFAWDGGFADANVQPEGDYTVSVRGLVPPDTKGPILPDSTLFFMQRQVRIDLTAPVVTILDVIPSDYAPETLHPDVVPEIHVRVSESQLEDAVQIQITDLPVDRVQDVLALVGGFSGDGDYVALCHDCSAADRFVDGVYVISAFASDVAGNRDSVGTLFDKNIAGPEFTLRSPRPAGNRDPAGRLHFQFADSLTGLAQDDRQPVDSVHVLIPFPPDTTRLWLPRSGGLSPIEYEFQLDLAPLLTAEGIYDMRLTATDNAQVSNEVPVSIVIDRTPDPPPTIVPRPPSQTAKQTLQFTVMTDLNTIRFVVIKGGADPTETLPVPVSEFPWQRNLNPGPNLMSFESIDFAGNVSVADTMTVVWNTAEGLIISERFHQGQSIQVDAGDSLAARVWVRIMALDGSLVRTFEDSSSRLVYAFPWDLTTPEGRAVKNGAYMVWAQVRYPNGRESRYRKMIAVVQ